VIVTVAEDVLVVVGTYRTLIVQVAPELTVAPEMQVPPGWIENVPFVVAVGLIVGFAESVSGVAFAPDALVTVMVPFLVVRLAVAVVSDGEGPEKDTVTPVTWKFTPPAVPIGVVTVTLLEVRRAPDPIAHDAFTVVAVGVPVIAHAMPAPLMVTAVAPVRPVPVMTTGTVVPRSPELGAMFVSVGPSTVNPTLLLVRVGVLTVML
jgi:hypothetical protein